MKLCYTKIVLPLITEKYKTGMFHLKRKLRCGLFTRKCARDHCLTVVRTGYVIGRGFIEKLCDYWRFKKVYTYYKSRQYTTMSTLNVFG
jgi:hypothetical protein